MAWIQRLIALCFFLLIITASFQCARRGTPSGGPKDEDPPILLKSEPDSMTTNFTSKKIRLYFDELVKLDDVQNQLIVSPPLKYQPDVTPQGAARKYVEIVIKDTLLDSTTYTFNFGQSIVDNNESNPNPFLYYVFSTGDYIDSLSLKGSVKDAIDKDVDEFVSVMLYEIDSTYSDSTVYNKLPNYITNTLDSTTVFELRNLKEGRYALLAVKDEGKNNLFDQRTDKIAFLEDFINIPTDSSFILTLFKEIPDFSVAQPSYAASNKIIFGYTGPGDSIEINPLTQLPDTIRTKLAKEPGKDTLNYWFTPFEFDSIVFEIKNPAFKQIDTFTVKSRKLAADSLVVTSSHRSRINFDEQFYIQSNIPIAKVDTTVINIINKDSLTVPFSANTDLPENKVLINFEKEPNETYQISILPQFLNDIFQQTNDTLLYKLSTSSLADFGNLRLNLVGDVEYPIILQLTDEKGETRREIIADKSRLFEFNNIEPGIYLIRLIFDGNANRIWDTGNYLNKIQAEKVIYYPQTLEVRANWELEQTFTIGG
ncbi:MAG: Ig-like domain-containing protein [Flavobacteriaceae bacterium]